MLADEVGPLAHVDVGTSAGLNLLLPRYSLRVRPGRRGGPAVRRCTCTAPRGGAVPVPADDAAASRVRSASTSHPIDVLDDDAVRWLEACVWPDQADRFARLVAAIGIARRHPPDVRSGDAVGDLAAR